MTNKRTWPPAGDGFVPDPEILAGLLKTHPEPITDAQKAEWAVKYADDIARRRREAHERLQIGVKMPDNPAPYKCLLDYPEYRAIHGRKR